MKKGPKVFLTILSVWMLVGAVECFAFAALYAPTPQACQALDSIELSSVNDYTTVYVEDLEILERYAFQTIHEYRDSENSYSDITFYVYAASEPMDKNELFGEYYIVKFRDKDGKEYITSLSVSADKDIAKTLRKAPLKISACLGAAPITEKKLLNKNDEQLQHLRETALNAYSKSNNIERANITLGYQTETIQQYQETFKEDVATTKVLSAVFGAMLLVGGVLLILLVCRKTKK